MKKIYLFACLFTLMSTFALKAQVTIGTQEAPVEGALLQLKQLSGIMSANVNAYKGLNLPRVNLTDPHQLYPMFLNNPVDPSSGANAQYAADSTWLKATHAGMIVYNINNNDPFFPGVYEWDGKRWINLSENTLTLVTGTINCSEITVQGTYVENTSMNGGNYLSMEVDVTKAGMYSITGVTVPDNGYHFTTSGFFPRPGKYNVNVPANGHPRDPNLLGDEISLTLNGMPSGCTNIRIPVLESAPDYTIIDVKPFPALYPVGKELDPADYYCMVTLNVKVPGPWTLVSNIVNGYSFSAQGNISSASGYNPNGTFPQLVTVTVPTIPKNMAYNYGSGKDNFTLSNTGSETPSSYPFTVNLASVDFSVNCDDAVYNDNGNALKQNTPLSGQTIILPVTVELTGETTITASGAGMVFKSADPVTLVEGTQNILLTADPSTVPSIGGDQVLAINSSKGGITSTCTIHVPVLQETATITSMTWISTNPNANYIINQKTGVNTKPTVTLSVISLTAGMYNITTEEINGVTYSGSGTLIASSGAQQIVLLPSGTPTEIVGTKVFTATNTGAGSAEPVTFNINFVYPAMSMLFVCTSDSYNLNNVRSYFNTSTQGNTTSVADQNYGVNGKIPTAGVTFTTATGGSGQIAEAVKSGDYDIILSGFPNSIWNTDDVNALVDFVNNGKVAFIGTENYDNTTNGNANITIRSVIQRLFTDVTPFSYNITTTPLWVAGPTGVSVYQATNIDDPLLNGPFGDIRNMYLGDDYANTSVCLSGVLPSDMIALANPVLGTTNLPASLKQGTSYFAIRHATKGFVWVGDAGFFGAFLDYPYYSRTTGLPTGYIPVTSPINMVDPSKPQAYYGLYGYAGLPTSVPVYNGQFMMNFTAWAIRYITQAPDITAP